MSSAYVLDASAVLAFLNQEAGADYVFDRIGGGAMSTVNLSEVIAKLVEEQRWTGPIRTAIGKLQLEAIPFTADAAEAAGLLRLKTRPTGLSLGDRACLALAIALGRPVLTTDRAWKSLPLDVEIELIR